jgi:isoleucyl-tRNA synthetase
VVLEGWVVAHDGNLSVAIDPMLDDELVLEGRALELIRSLNEQRKQEGFDLTDRITLTLPGVHADLADRFKDWIAAEVLATSITIDDGLGSPTMTRVVTED